MNIGLTVIVLVSIFSILADIILKKAADNNNYIFLIIGCGLYVLDAFFWFIAYKYSKFSTVGILYSLSVVFLSVLTGIFYFKERINIVEVIGLVLGFVSIILLSRFK